MSTNGSDKSATLQGFIAHVLHLRNTRIACVYLAIIVEGYILCQECGVSTAGLDGFDIKSEMTVPKSIHSFVASQSAATVNPQTNNMFKIVSIYYL